MLWRLSPIEREVAWDYDIPGVVTALVNYVAESGEQSETWKAWLATQNYSIAPDGKLGKSGSRAGSVVW